jgi:hypothetical protein
MNNENPVLNAACRARRMQEGRCVICGRAADIERHHVQIRAHESKLTVPLCRHCHIRETENLRIAGVVMEHTDNPFERMYYALRGTAIFLSSLSESLLMWCELLRNSSGQQINSSGRKRRATARK